MSARIDVRTFAREGILLYVDFASGAESVGEGIPFPTRERRTVPPEVTLIQSDLKGSIGYLH